MKVCSNCKIDKPLTDYYKMKHCSFGVSNICIPCHKIRARVHYLKNKETYLERAAKWGNENKERRRQIVNKYDHLNIEAKRARGAANSKRKRKIDPEGERLKGRHHAHLRRARLNNVKKSATKEDSKYVLKASNGICIYCNSPVEKITIDHFIPITKGGNHDLLNLLPCCKSCNSSKKDKNGYDWLIEKKNLQGLKRIESFFKKSKGYLNANKNAGNGQISPLNPKNIVRQQF